MSVLRTANSGELVPLPAAINSHGCIKKEWVKWIFFILFRVDVLSFLQCFYNVGWVTGRKSVTQLRQLSLKVLFRKSRKEKNHWGIRPTGSSWKWPLNNACDNSHKLLNRISLKGILDLFAVHNSDRLPTIGLNWVTSCRVLHPAPQLWNAAPLGWDPALNQRDTRA